MEHKKQYLVHIRLTEKLHTPEGLKDIYSRIFNSLNDFVENRGDLSLAYTSHDGTTMGFLIRTQKNTKQVMAHFFPPYRSGEPAKRNILYGNDQILIIELGNDVSGSEDFSLVKKWLSHG